MPPLSTTRLRQKVRRLTTFCLVLGFLVTLAPALIARQPGLTLGDWPLDFWMAAQGSVLVYLLIVVVYAGLVNRWEREAGSLSFELPPSQDV